MTTAIDRIPIAKAHTLPVVGSIVVRSLTRIRRMPSAFMPSLAMPVFQLIAFSGAFAGAIAFAGIDSAIDWYMPMAAIQGAAFGAMGLTFAMVNDLQTGFFDRMFMSPAGRSALIYGPLAASVVRAIVPVVLVLVIGFAAGAALPGGPLGIVLLAIAALGVAYIAGGFGLGLALRMKTVAAAALMQFGIFFAIFLSTAQMPLEFIEGWVKPLATINPMTRILAMARQGFLGDITWSVTWKGLLAIVVWGTVTTIYARRSLTKFDR